MSVCVYIVQYSSALTSCCTLTEAESLVVICFAIRICQRFFLLMNCQRYQEQNLPAHSHKCNSQLVTPQVPMNLVFSDHPIITSILGLFYN